MLLEVLVSVLTGVHREGDTDEQGKDFLCGSGNQGGGASSFPLAFLFNLKLSCVIYLSQLGKSSQKTGAMALMP